MIDTIIARTATLDAITAGMARYDLRENTPTRFRSIYCANNDGRRADIWADDGAPLCGKCYLELIEAESF